MEHTTTIATKPAAGHGDIDGWTVTCQCGERAAFSVYALAEEHGLGHVAYMARKAARA